MHFTYADLNLFLSDN